MYIRSDIRYARAFFDLTEQKQVSKDIYLQLPRISALAKAMSQCAEWLDSPSLSKEKKREIYSAIFVKEYSEIMQLIKLLISFRRENRLSQILELWANLYRKKYGIVRADLVMAIEDDSFVSLVRKAVMERTGKQVEIDVKYDKQIIGGFVLNVDGLVSDHSVAGRINMLWRKMGN
ncbi:MAG: ATP synthase F1 subunit delta [Bacteroidales bacterium]|jgi:F-type H+-transporting ATPase subunit delta|nr:ATP synthase F1 subunit delta [Bacteroidales bacterium]